MSLRTRTAPAEDLRITGYRPELMMQIVGWMAQFFLQQWGSDTEIRQRFVTEVQNFLVELDNPRNAVLCGWIDETLIGTVAIDGQRPETEGARIRWFIVDERYRGQGYGRLLFERAIEYCQTAGYDRITLCTYKGIDPALALYGALGFTLVEEKNVSTATTQMVEQYFEKSL